MTNWIMTKYWPASKKRQRQTLLSHRSKWIADVHESVLKPDLTLYACLAFPAL